MGALILEAEAKGLSTRDLPNTPPPAVSARSPQPSLRGLRPLPPSSILFHISAVQETQQRRGEEIDYSIPAPSLKEYHRFLSQGIRPNKTKVCQASLDF